RQSHVVTKSVRAVPRLATAYVVHPVDQQSIGGDVGRRLEATREVGDIDPRIRKICRQSAERLGGNSVCYFGSFRVLDRLLACYSARCIDGRELSPHVELEIQAGFLRDLVTNPRN